MLPASSRGSTALCARARACGRRATFLATLCGRRAGPPPLAHVNADDTTAAQAYRARPGYLARRGRYVGPTELRRLRAMAPGSPSAPPDY